MSDGTSTTSRDDRSRLNGLELKGNWQERFRTLRDFASLVVTKSSEDAITLKAAALAFATMLGIVPLLAVFGFMGTRLVDQYEDRLLDVLMSALPYSESALTEKIELYTHQAESLQGLGLLAFLFVGVNTLHTIEETINKIWRVSERASIRAKVLSLALVLFWGPVLAAAMFSLFVMARRHIAFGVLLEESFVLGALPFLITAAGLTMLYWQVPRARVRFRWALVGGLVAAFLLELLRRPFSYYTGNFSQLGIVYGSFAIAIFFMISIQIAWGAILLGAEAAYVGQHFKSLLYGRRVDARAHGPWVGLAALIALAQALRRGDPLCTPEELGQVLGIPPQVLDDSIGPLLSHGLVVTTGGDGLMLGRDAHELRVEEILSSYNGPVDAMLEHSSGPDWSRLDALRDDLRRVRDEELHDLRLVDLLPNRDSPTSPPADLDSTPKELSDADPTA
ncbi:MAG: YihY family inner membrane protein [Thermoanaerobaculia bacterium]|nr:YihY family inner membrane protein [Thermoanaerobaculia bacterium]